jgi:hypothetical protein
MSEPQIMSARDVGYEVSTGLSQLAGILDCIQAASTCEELDAIGGAARFARFLGERADEIGILLGGDPI